MTMRRLLILSATGVSLFPSVVFAHAAMTSSEPAENGVLAAGATDVTLVFNEPVKTIGCSMKDAAGKDAPVIGAAEADGAQVHVALISALMSGTYSLTCNVVGPDNHPTSGTVTFKAAGS